MAGIKKQRGAVAIIIVVGTTITFAMAVLYLYILVNAKINAIQSANDRFLAYYLCETGVSVAMIDLKSIPKPPEWPKRDFDFTIGKKIYKIHYEISKAPGSSNYKVLSRVHSPLGLNKTYYLTASGPRAFPIFIRGFAGAGGK